MSFSSVKRGNRSFNITDSFTLPYKTVALIVILFLAIFSRFSGLSTIPLQPREMPVVVSALEVTNAENSGDSAFSPLLYMMYQAFFAVFEANTILIRFPNAALGILIVFCPFLFRKLLSDEHCIIIAILLLISPLLLLASRSAESAIFALFGSVILFYALFQSYIANPNTRKRQNWQLISAFLLSITLFLTDGRSYILLGSTIIALAFSVRSETEIKKHLRQLLKTWPWQNSMLVGIGSVLFLSTGFFTEIDGLNHVGNNLYSSLRGLISSDDFFNDFRVSLFYEIGFWILTLIALITLRRNKTPSPLKKFSIFWLFTLLALLTLDRGSQAPQVSWLSIPLAIIVADSLKSLIERKRPLLFYRVSRSDIPISSIMVVVSFILLLWIGIQIRILLVRTNFLNYLLEILNSSFILPPSDVLWWSIRVLFGVFLYIVLLIGFQVFSNRLFVGRIINFQLALILLFFTLNTGIRAVSSGNHTEKSGWLPQRTSNESIFFYETLQDLAHLPGEEPGNALALVLENDSSLSQQSTLFWLLRDFEDVVFLPELELAFGYPIILSNHLLLDQDADRLTDHYVGQQFVLVSENQSEIFGVNFIKQFMPDNRNFHSELYEAGLLSVVLWVRVDVVESVFHNSDLEALN